MKRHRTWNRLGLIGTALILGAAGLLLAVPEGVAAPARVDKVTLRLDWVLGSEHAPIWASRDKGFFREEGLDVQVFPGEGSTVTLKLVGNKNNDFGYASGDSSMIAFSKGVPVKVVAVLFQKPPAAIVYPTDRPVKRFEDLYGRRLGTLGLKSVVHKQWEAMAARHNIDRSKIREISVGTAAAKAMEAGVVDAFVGWWITDGLILRTRGHSVDWMRFADLGLQFYGTSIVAHEDMVRQKPDLVRKANPNIDPAYARAKIPAVVSLAQSETTKRLGLGASTREEWEAMQKMLLEFKILDAPIELAKLYTNDFLR
ncbi:MAG: ABC transporter substrate-binding protein [Deltaproteobacteria bacterium]|nr:ABC transporter substrate-binding protein [Deltaproteobacteria bacterium]